MFLSSEGKKLYKFYSQYHSNFLLALEKAKAGDHEDDIHSFRVSIKKIRGVLKLVDLLNENFNYKIQFAQFRALYKPAGNIRECQVNLRRLTPFNPPETYLAAYREARGKCTATFRINFDHALKELDKKSVVKTQKLVKIFCQVISKEQLYRKIKKFIKVRISDIKELHATAFENIDNVHDIRILLKEITAVLGLLNYLHPKGISQKYLLELKEYENKIGYWHDLEVLVDSLSAFNTSLLTTSLELQSEGNHLMAIITKEQEAFIENLDQFITDLIQQIGISVDYLTRKIDRLMAKKEEID